MQHLISQNERVAGLCYHLELKLVKPDFSANDVG